RREGDVVARREADRRLCRDRLPYEVGAESKRQAFGQRLSPPRALPGHRGTGVPLPAGGRKGGTAGHVRVAGGLPRDVAVAGRNAWIGSSEGPPRISKIHR